MAAIEEGRNGVTMNIKVVPGASRNNISFSESGDYVRVSIVARAERGEANKAVISLFEGLLGDCELLYGHKSRRKRIFVKNRCAEEVRQKLLEF